MKTRFITVFACIFVAMLIVTNKVCTGQSENSVIRKYLIGTYPRSEPFSYKRT